MQFNIAFEEAAQERLRYGLAFSLRASQALPNPLVLRPKNLKRTSTLRRTNQNSRI